MDPIKNIAELFLQKAEETPEKIAIIEKDDQITFDELKKQVQRTAAYFKSKGIQKGDRVLVFVPMSIDLYRIALALFYIGATAVFLDEWSDRKRLAICCEMAECNGLVGTWKARIFAFFSKPLRTIPIKLSKSRMKNEVYEINEVTADHPALITFTTGSTGKPKAALRTHSFLKNQFETLIDEIDPQLNDIALPLLPIVLFLNLGFGCTSVVPNVNLKKPRKFKAGKLARQIQNNKVTRLTASPFFIRELSKYLMDEHIQLPSLLKIFAGGAPVFPSEADLYSKAFPQAKSTILYGSTEAEPISSISANELSRREEDLHRGLPVGKVVPNATVKILRIQEGAIDCDSEIVFDQLCLEEGAIGEIVVSGPHVLTNYFKNLKAFRENKIQVNGTLWHRTGDAGYFKGGEMYLTGRVKHMIKVDREWLSPFIIENQLQKIKGITAGTILDIGNKIVLCVKTRIPESRLKPLIRHIPYDKIQIIKNLPKDPRHHSKIDYESLKKLVN